MKWITYLGVVSDSRFSSVEFRPGLDLNFMGLVYVYSHLSLQAKQSMELIDEHQHVRFISRFRSLRSSFSYSWIDHGKEETYDENAVSENKQKKGERTPDRVQLRPG